MHSRSLKQLLTGLAIIGSCLPAIALADPTCVYVFGTVNGQIVTTPAVLVVVPGSSEIVQPVQVHVDPTNQTILGYSVTAPGATVGTSGAPVMVPGTSQEIPTLTVRLPALNLAPSRCVDVNGTTIPAVPVQVNGSALTLPGATAAVGSIIVNILGNPFTAPGHVVTFDGKTIVIPQQNAGTPSVPVGTPNQSITVNVNGVLEQAHYLPPNQ